MQIKLFLLLFGVSLGGTLPQGNDLLLRIQASWERTKSYQATFNQTITSKRMGTKDTSSGEVLIQKPGRIRWESKTDGKTQILNGKKLTHIQTPKRRKAKIVDIFENIKSQMDTRGLAFLAGTEEFSKTYSLKIIGETPKMVTVKIDPLQPGMTDSYIAEFDKSSYLLRSLATESADTSVRTEFTEIRTNQEFADELFMYKPGPKDVVTVNK